MGPKQRLMTTAWCAVTMMATMLVSHGHLVIKEIMLHWPTEDSWESRLEGALYTQGGLTFLSSCVIGGVILIRGYFVRRGDEEIARKERSQKERHERAAEQRHEAMMETLAQVAGGISPKKSQASGVRPK